MCVVGGASGVVMCHYYRGGCRGELRGMSHLAGTGIAVAMDTRWRHTPSLSRVAPGYIGP